MNNNQGFVVSQPGVQCLLQDAGRYGVFNLGLTNGGPADPVAFSWANRLCGNAPNATAIEINMGGLQLTVKVDTLIAVAGAPMPLSINGKHMPLWHSFYVKAGDSVAIGYAPKGVRCYLAVKGGFTVAPSFGSTSTVCRESTGGLNGNKLTEGDFLPCQVELAKSDKNLLLMLPEQHQPSYSNELILHTILSYQHKSFSTVSKRLFFSSEYQVSKSWDRMGYRLQGQVIKSELSGILSEGIAYGAVQVPADGQPIVLLNDRQTIGGYPKIGSVISSDCAKLAQLRQGDKVRFEACSMSQADNLFHLNLSRYKQIKLVHY